jgi:hypothetical protein
MTCLGGDEMSATIRIRRAQLHGAMNLWCVQSIAALQQGRRLVNASAASKQLAALTGIGEYWITHALPSQEAAGHDRPGTLDLGNSLFDKPIIHQEEIAVL